MSPKMDSWEKAPRFPGRSTKMEWSWTSFRLKVSKLSTTLIVSFFNIIDFDKTESQDESDADDLLTMSEVATLSDPLFSYLTYQVFSDYEKFWSDAAKIKRFKEKLST